MASGLNSFSSLNDTFVLSAETFKKKLVILSGLLEGYLNPENDSVDRYSLFAGFMQELRKMELEADLYLKAKNRIESYFRDQELVSPCVALSPNFYIPRKQFTISEKQIQTELTELNIYNKLTDNIIDPDDFPGLAEIKRNSALLHILNQ